MSLSLLAISEESRGLDDDLGAKFFPGQVSGVALGKNLDGLAVNGDGVIVVTDLTGETTHDGVVLQEVGQGLGVGEVVDGDDLEVSTLLSEGAEKVAANAAKTVDTNLNGH